MLFDPRFLSNFDCSTGSVDATSVPGGWSDQRVIREASNNVVSENTAREHAEPPMHRLLCSVDGRRKKMRLKVLDGVQGTFTLAPRTCVHA